MKRLILALVLVAPGVAMAQPVGNDAKGAGETLKSVLNLTEPGISHFYDAHSGEWYTGMGISLYNLKSDSITLGSIRAIYAADYKFAGELQANLGGLSQKFIAPHLSESVSDALTTGAVGKTLELVGKHVGAGVIAGWNGDRQEDGNSRVGGFMAGASLDATFRF